MSLPCQPIYSSWPFPTAGLSPALPRHSLGMQDWSPIPQPCWLLPTADDFPNIPVPCHQHQVSWYPCCKLCSSFAGPSACWGAPSTHSMPVLEIFAEASGILWEKQHPAPLAMLLGTAQLLWDLGGTGTEVSCHCHLPPSCRRQ